MTKRMAVYLLACLLVITGCKRLDEETDAPTYVRVIDLRLFNSADNGVFMSSFKWDDAFFGNKDLDSIQHPRQVIPQFGDFLLGRRYFQEDAGLYT